MRYLRNILAISVLAALTFVYFSDILFSDRLFSFRDLSRYYYPMRVFAFEQLKHGVFPFWNPYVSSGHPLFAALQSVILYPLSFVYLIFDFNFAFNFFIILHIFLGGVFFYLLMRDLKFAHISALISAVVFMFSGYLIGVINLTTTLSAAIWFPLVFLFYNRALEQKKIFYMISTAVFMGLMFLGGEPTPLYATIFLLGIYSLVMILEIPKDWISISFTLIASILLMGLLFSFQIIPFVEFIRLSTRAWTDYNAAACWSFPPRDLINFILPFFYGPLTFNIKDPIRQDWLLLTYLGSLPIILFIVSFLFRRDKMSSLFKLMFLVGLILVFGRFTPVYKLLYTYLPGFSMIRYPIKFFFLSAVAFSFLCGAGWQEYCRRVDQNDKHFLSFIKGIFVFAFILALLFLAIYIYKTQIFILAENFIRNLNLKDKELNFQYFMIFMVDLFNLRRLLLILILGCVLLFVGARAKVRKGLLGAVIIGLIFLDLLGGKNIDINPTLPAELLRRETTNISFLKEDKELFRIFSSFKMIKENEVLKGDTYENAFAKSLDSLCPNRHIEFGIQQARGYLSVHNENYSKVINLVDTSPSPSSTNILSMLNVKYVITPGAMTDSRYRLVSKGVNAYIYENPDFLPRAYLVSDFVIIDKEQEISSKLKSKEFNPAKLVILEEKPAQTSQQGGKLGQKSEEKEYVNIAKYGANKVEIETYVSDKPKFLVLADNYYPGWEAYVDGKKQKIYRANFILRGVYLEEGRHRIVFIFNPVSFKIGLLISVLTFILILVVGIINKIKR